MKTSCCPSCNLAVVREDRLNFPHQPYRPLNGARIAFGSVFVTNADQAPHDPNLAPRFKCRCGHTFVYLTGSP